jgi:hypothetical protein
MAMAMACVLGQVEILGSIPRRNMIFLIPLHPDLFWGCPMVTERYFSWAKVRHM